MKTIRPIQNTKFITALQLLILLGTFFTCLFCFDKKAKIKLIYSLTKSSYSIGGTVSGLSGTLSIQNNSSETLSITASGSFNFANSLSDGGTYSVSILTQPSLQTCTITNGTGIVASANITNISISCVTTQSLSSVSSLSALFPSSGALNPTFSSGTTSYTFSVLNSNTSITITPTTTDANSTVTVNGTSVTSGTASSSISLNVGSNTISVLVTAQNLTTTTYTLTVIRSTLNAYRIFVSNTTTDGNIQGSSTNGPTGADIICNADANKPTDGSIYKAILVDGINRAACTTTPSCTATSENIDWVLKAGTDYARTNGTAIFTTNSAGIFLFGTLTNSFNGGGQYWTGISTVSFWRISGGSNDCSKWTSNSAGLNGNIGNGSSTDKNSIAFTTGACNTTNPILCAEQ